MMKAHIPCFNELFMIGDHTAEEVVNELIRNGMIKVAHTVGGSDEKVVIGKINKSVFYN